MAMNQQTTTGGSPMDERTTTFSGEKSPTLAVVETVASVSGRDPTALPPLYNAVNPDALDALFASSDSRDTSDLRVSFSYNGFDVVVEGGETITVRLEDRAD